MPITFPWEALKHFSVSRMSCPPSQWQTSRRALVFQMPPCEPWKTSANPPAHPWLAGGQPALSNRRLSGHNDLWSLPRCASTPPRSTPTRLRESIDPACGLPHHWFSLFDAAHASRQTEEFILQWLKRLIWTWLATLLSGLSKPHDFECDCSFNVV